MPTARRSSSASSPLNPAVRIAMRSSCSWNSGTPRVFFNTGRRSWCGYVIFSFFCLRRMYGCIILPTIGPGRMMATCTTMS